MNEASKQRMADLKDLFRNFDGDLKDKFIARYPEIWDDCYDIMEDSRYHRVMINSMLAGYQAGMQDQDANKKPYNIIYGDEENLYRLYCEMEKIAGDRFKRIEKLEAENKRLRETIDFAIGHLSSMENYSIVSGAIHALKESKGGEEKLHVIEKSAYQKAVDALKSLVNSQVVKQAPFIGYSEAYLLAKNTLKELGEL